MKVVVAAEVVTAFARVTVVIALGWCVVVVVRMVVVVAVV